ncbi:u4 u6 small nuclear ribonucleoprotein [Moniliophthora roreri MCA 2997]|uniref:U4 u6 small nuclear ribonucleoprotein n=1 Tax=Moniliophthora roreri (strain MCA 2997) TaxID=1381753 RepID=V2WB42_MONRO|nr:u4 u6 small nuclear ribonucleoprotein [Moniliophthora roreri MCA 2997]
MSDRKRPLDTSADPISSKKLKSDNSANGSSSPAVAIPDASLIAQKRAEIAAKVAAMRNSALGAGTMSIPIQAPAPKVPTTIPKIPSPSVSSGPTPATGSPTPGTPGTPIAPGLTDDIARRVAEAKRKVAEYQSKLAVKDNPYMSMPQTGKNKNRLPEPAQQGSGLKMTAHPLLLDQTPAAPQSKKDRYKPMQPKFASIKANTRNAPTPAPPTPPVAVVETANPYASASSSKDTGFEGAPRERAGRSFKFNQKGKYIAQGNQMRQEQQLEALKQRIAESARKAGLDGDMGIERNIKRPPPPEAEWWDAGLLPSQQYDDLSMGFENLNIRNADSPVTIYVQHPIPIPGPGDKNKVALKPLMLTKKEQKKMRKLKRAAELQDKRDKIKMGLLPPDAPKVRLANLMKVLTSDAVQDPTRVEAKVRREVAMRKHTHEKMNAERKLTDEQRKDKIENKKVEEEKKGIYGAVFKVKKLSDPAHRFKVRKNAEQLNLSGVCIFNPNFSMVYVEGAAKFIRQYKRLMLHRIAWTEAARPRGGEDVEIDNGDEDAEGAESSAGKGKDRVMDGEGGPESLEGNKCWLIWEGLLKHREFNNFKPRSCPTDGAAKEVLGDKLKGYWDQAKNWKPEEEELF